MSSKYIKNLYETTPAGEMSQGTRFASKHRPISPDVGAAKLGYNLTELDPDAAHQITNDGSVPLKYLALSTMQDPEVVEYPDSGKYGVTVGRKAGRPAQESAFRMLAFKKDGVDYWAGEDTENE